jgi:Flp pilus assembly protein TadG
MRQLRHKQQGAVLILAVAAMVAMLGLVGLALDGGHAMLNKTRLQNTVDAAALSGAKELDLTDDTVQARAAAISAFAANAAADGNHELQEQYAADGSVLRDTGSLRAGIGSGRVRAGEGPGLSHARMVLIDRRRDR